VTTSGKMIINQEVDSEDKHPHELVLHLSLPDDVIFFVTNREVKKGDELCV